MELLSKLQKELIVEKKHYSDYGGYWYRNCEDILEAVKKLLPEKASIVCDDDIILVGDRYYIKATVILKDSEGHIESSSALAREAPERKKMDLGQVTATASSYARKRALEGLFGIDDFVAKDEESNIKDTLKLNKEQQKILNTVCDQLVIPEGFESINKMGVKAAIINASQTNKFPTDASKIPDIVYFISQKPHDIIFENGSEYPEADKAKKTTKPKDTTTLPKDDYIDAVFHELVEAAPDGFEVDALFVAQKLEPLFDEGLKIPTIEKSVDNFKNKYAGEIFKEKVNA